MSIKKWLSNIIKNILNKNKRVKTKIEKEIVVDIKEDKQGCIVLHPQDMKIKKMSKVDETMSICGIEKKYKKLVIIYFKTKKHRVRKKQIKRLCEHWGKLR